jgi:hypothetical protein
MTTPGYCDICGETYDVDNLIACSRCTRDFCYRCGDSGAAVCIRCREKTG